MQLLTDQSTECRMGMLWNSISGADGTAIGTGNQNTIDIEAGCTTTGTAADICANLTLGGYSDWFLPSKDELNRNVFKFSDQGCFRCRNTWWFCCNYYWSSTEDDYNNAWRQNFYYGSQNYNT